jgi:DNA polymerase alpha-associated DNA helicase A
MLTIGHPARILESVHHHVLDVRIKHSDYGVIIQDIKIELDSKLKKVIGIKKRQDRREMFSKANSGIMTSSFCEKKLYINKKRLK